MMGDAQLRVIATELVNALRTNVTVDWYHRENARARMRTLVDFPGKSGGLFW